MRGRVVEDLLDRRQALGPGQDAHSELTRAQAGRIELGGETQDVAVLFVDLVGSTELAATRPPHEVGAPTRYEYTVIGDPVNEAARLTEVAKDPGIGGIAASGSALDRAGAEEAARWRAAGSRVLRGRGTSTAFSVPADPPGASGG